MTAPGAWILVVDDDEDIRELVGLVLGYTGYHAVGAANGIDALERLRTCGRPSLIFLDLMMPRLSGVDFMKELRAVPEFADTPVVIMSGDSDARQAAAALGTQGCVTKPFELEAILGIARRFVPLPA